MMWFYVSIISCCAVLLTGFFSRSLGMRTVLSSALVSLLGVLFVRFVPLFSSEITSHIPAVVMGASFVGMSSARMLRSFVALALAGCIFGIVYTLGLSYVSGYGGGLGLLALISVIIVWILHQLVSF